MSYESEKKLIVSVERGTTDGVQEDYLRVNVWQAEGRRWSFYDYPWPEVDPAYVARLALASVNRERPLGALRYHRDVCPTCGQERT